MDFWRCSYCLELWYCIWDTIFQDSEYPPVNDSCFFNKLTAWNQCGGYRRPWFLRAILSCLANYCFQILKFQSLHFYMKGHLRSRATLGPGKAPAERHHGSHSSPALFGLPYSITDAGPKEYSSNSLPENLPFSTYLLGNPNDDRYHRSPSPLQKHFPNPLPCIFQAASYRSSKISIFLFLLTLTLKKYWKQCSCNLAPIFRVHLYVL